MALHLTGSIGVSDSITSTHFSGSMSGSFQGDGSRLTGIGGGGTTINTTDNVIPVRSDATTFVDSPITAINGDQVIGGTQFALDNVQFSEFSPGLNPGDHCNFTFQNTQTLGTIGDPVIWQVTTELNSGDGTVIPVGVYTGTITTAPNNTTGLSATFSNDSGWTLGGSDITAPASSAGILGVGSTFSTVNQTTITSDLTISGSAEITGSLEVTGSVSFSTEIAIEGPGVWSTGGNLQNGGVYSLAGAGTQTAGLAFGGFNFTVGLLNLTEEYNGAAWGSGGNLSTAKWLLAGAGTQTAGLSISGNVGGSTNVTEEYNGAAWSPGGNISSQRSRLAGAGTQTAALAFGGDSGTYGCTEEYNGTSWSVASSLSNGRFDLAGAGTQTAGLAFGGIIVGGVRVSCTEEYDGTSWSVASSLLNGRDQLAGAGTPNAGLAFGGCTPTKVSCTEKYNGTSWSEGSAMISAVSQLAGAGTQTAGLAIGGFAAGGLSSATEEYNPNTIQSIAKTFDYSKETGNITISNGVTLELTGSAKFKGITSTNPASWNTGGSLSNPRSDLAGTGTVYASLAIGGYDSSLSAMSYFTEEYNGASWSAGGVLSTNVQQQGAAGTQTAGLSFGGYNGSYSLTTATEEYDGTTWSTGGVLTTPRKQLAGTGTQTAALAIGGFISNQTEEYNGAAWGSGGNLNTARGFLAGVGELNAATAFGGIIAGGVKVSCTEEYDGTVWLTCTAMTTPRYGLGGAGIQTDAFAFGGRDTIPVTCTEKYNGTSWSADASMLEGRYTIGSSGTSAKALAFGGYPSTGVGGCTERYAGAIIGGETITALDFSKTTGETMIIPPTTDPLVVGALWNSNGVLTISLG